MRWKMLIDELGTHLLIDVFNIEESLLNKQYLQRITENARLTYLGRAVVVAQLAEWSLPTPEVRGSNPAVGQNYIGLNICLL